MMFSENPPPRLLPVSPDRSGPATLRYGLLTLLLLAVAAAGCQESVPGDLSGWPSRPTEPHARPREQPAETVATDSWFPVLDVE